MSLLIEWEDDCELAQEQASGVKTQELLQEIREEITSSYGLEIVVGPQQRTKTNLKKLGEANTVIWKQSIGKQSTKQKWRPLVEPWSLIKPKQGSSLWNRPGLPREESWLTPPPPTGKKYMRNSHRETSCRSNLQPRITMMMTKTKTHIWKWQSLKINPSCPEFYSSLDIFLH